MGSRVVRDVFGAMAIYALSGITGITRRAAIKPYDLTRSNNNNRISNPVHMLHSNFYILLKEHKITV